MSLTKCGQIYNYDLPFKLLFDDGVLLELAHLQFKTKWSQSYNKIKTNSNYVTAFLVQTLNLKLLCIKKIINVYRPDAPLNLDPPREIFPFVSPHPPNVLLYKLYAYNLCF